MEEACVIALKLNRRLGRTALQSENNWPDVMQVVKTPFGMFFLTLFGTHLFRLWVVRICGLLRQLLINAIGPNISH